MNKTIITFTMDIEVYDPEAFAAAARKHAVEVDKYPQGEADEEYTADKLTACAQMLFDPGSGPAGCDIRESAAEIIREEED